MGVCVYFLWVYRVLQYCACGYILSPGYQFLTCTLSFKAHSEMLWVFQICVSTNTFFSCGAILTCSEDKCLFLVCTCLQKKWSLHLLMHALFPRHSPLTSACPCQSCCPKTAPTWSSWTEAGWLSESVPESAARPLPESYDSHSSSFPFPRGQASSSSARRNDPSVWHAQNPKSPHFGVWVQIPPPGGQAGTSANDSELRRVSTLVSASIEAVCQPSCTFFP